MLQNLSSVALALVSTWSRMNNARRRRWLLKLYFKVKFLLQNVYRNRWTADRWLIDKRHISRVAKFKDTCTNAHTVFIQWLNVMDFYENNWRCVNNNSYLHVVRYSYCMSKSLLLYMSLQTISRRERKRATTATELMHMLKHAQIFLYTETCNILG